MKPQLKMELSLTMLLALLSACSPKAAYAEVPPPTPAPTCTSAVETGLNDGIELQDVPTVDVIGQMVEAYMNSGTVSVVELSAEQQEAFANKLAEKLNETKGAKPVIYNHEAYVDPATGMLTDYDGHPDLEETIQTFYPATLDSKGNLYITTPDGKQKIKGSQGIDWNMFVTDPSDERINWPTGKKYSSDFSPPADDIEFGSQLIPMIMLDTKVDQLYLTGKPPGIVPTITLFDIITDVNDIPIMARKVIVHSATEFSLYKEGSDYCVWQNTIDSLWDGFSKTKTREFFTSLEPNQAYFLVFSPHQSGTYEGGNFDPPDDYYENIIAVDDVLPVLTGQQPDNINTAILAIKSLIQIGD